MRSLEQALHDHELIILRVLGEWMDLDLTGADKPACVKALVEAFAQINVPREIGFLPPEEVAAMEALLAAGGRMPVAAFSRSHGEVRLMGPGRLEREEPWYDPASPAEALWYRGFLYRAFDKTAEGMVEFFYLPNEFLAQYPREQLATAPLVVERLAPTAPPSTFADALSAAVDDMTTLLIAAQQGVLPNADPALLAAQLIDTTPARYAMLISVGEAAELLRQTKEGLRPARPAGGWLREGREAQLRALAEAWTGAAWVELCHTPGLRCEGSGWVCDPLLARSALLETVPRDESWYAIDDLLALIKENDPDFLRPDGDYDSWYVRDVEAGEFLRGFANWDGVEGRLLRFILSGPLHWLGMTDCSVDAYRLTPRGVAWLLRTPIDRSAEKEVAAQVTPEATLRLSPFCQRLLRFQAARIAEPLPREPGQPFVYVITPASLARAQEDGIPPDKVLSFLERAAGSPPPPSVRRAVERWRDHGVEARLQPAVVLRVADEEILEKLRANPKTRPFIGESLGTLAAAVRADQWAALREAAAQLGLFLESELQS